jgi:hypothetical protein
MRIPEDRMHLHFAAMMIGMAWERLSSASIEASEEDEKAAWEKFERCDRAQSLIWAKLSTEEREFYNYVHRQAKLAQELRSTIASWQSEATEEP